MKLSPLWLTAVRAAATTNTAAEYRDLAFRMIRSIEERGQAVLSGSGGTGLIQLSIFQQSLAVATESPYREPADHLRSLLTHSLASTIPEIANATHDLNLPLDRFSLGANLAAWSLSTGNKAFLPAIAALNASYAAQPRNANGGLWYYDNPANFTAYRNLSYLDGMYSVPPFLVSQARLEDEGMVDGEEVLEAAVEQVRILHDICVKPSGLLMHGYDAVKAHAWADSRSGASPEVWGRSLAWYSLGLLGTLEFARGVPGLPRSTAYKQLQRLFREAMDAQIRAAEHSRTTTGKPGVWQVVDRPGESRNFVEASSSFMTAYTILRALRLGLIPNKRHRGLTTSASTLAEDIYNTVSQEYLVPYNNGSLSLNGTSEIASLSVQNVGYEYYVTRQRVMDSLIGTSAFVLASLELARLGDGEVDCAGTL